MATSGPLERQSSGRESAIFKQTIRERTGEREEIHKKTFGKWINTKLAMAVPPLEVTDLIEEIRDGHVLLSLLEVLLGKTLKREKGRMRVHKLNNVSTALTLLEKNRVKLVGISNYDIVDGKSTPILGLVWSIILRFQVQGVMTENESDASVKDFQVEKKLLSWCQTSLDGYEDVVKLKDFTSSWRDGLAFNAIIHTHKPELFRFERLLQNDNRTNLEHAFTVASDEFSVPKLLDPADIDVDKPDKKLIIMYLTSLYHGLREYSPQGGRKRRKLDDLTDLEAYRAALKEVKLYISQVENIVKTKLETTVRFVDPQEEYKTSKSLKEDISNHRQDVEDVIDKGEALMKNEKTDEIHCTEIKNEIQLLHERWEKLEILSQRLHKRCRGAVASPREQQIDIYITWIMQMRREIAARGQSTNPVVIKDEIKQHEGAISRIEQKLPEIDRVINEVDQLCQEPYIEEEDRVTLHGKLKDLNTNWDEMRTEALQKETDLQEKLAQSTPTEENVETEVLVQIKHSDVQSTPSDFSTLEIQPQVQYVVETQPSVHNLIDFTDGQDPDTGQVDSSDKEAERDSKLAKLHDKRNAIMLVLRNGSQTLDNLRSRGAPSNLQEVKEQQNIVKECDSQLKAGEPLFQDVILYGRELTQDDLFDENEKENIARDMAQLQENYDDLRNFVDDEQESLDDLYLEMEKRNKIRDWEAKRDVLNDKLDLCEEKLRNQKQNQSPDDFKERLATAKELSDEVRAVEPEVRRVTDSGNSLLQSENLDVNHKDQLVKDLHDIEDRYEDLKKNTTDEVTRLEDAVSREDTERTEKLDKWHEIKENTSKMIVDSRSKLDGIKSKDPQTTPEIQKELQEIEECTNDIASAFPEIQSGYDYGNELLGDKQLSEEEKNTIEKDMDSLGEEFQILQKDFNDEQNRLNALLSDAYAEDEKKMKKWMDWRDKLNSKYKKTRGKFNKIKGQGIPKEPKKVQEQLENTRECSSEIAVSVPEIQEAFEYANKLISDKGVDPSEKEAIRKDVNEIGDGFKNLKLELNDYEKELESLSLKQEEEKVEKIERWEIWIIRIRELQHQCQEKAEALKSVGEPQNKKDVVEQMILAKECKEELEAAKPVIHEGLDYGKLLLDDDVIDDDVKAEIKKDVNDVEYNLDKMEKDNADEQGRLEVLAVQYDTDKKDKLGKWETWKVKLRSILALKRGHLDELKAEDPSNNNVEELLAKAKDCEDSLQSSEPEIKFALDYGEQLVDDDLTDPDEKQKIQEDVVQMERYLKDLKEEAAKEKIRLEQIYVKQNEEREQKLKQWEIWMIRITELEKKCQVKLGDLKSKGEPQDKTEVEDQIILAKEFQEELQSAKPVITDGLEYGKHLLEDDLIDEDNKAKIRQDVHHLEGDLGKLEQANDDEHKRLEEALQEHGEKEKLKNWENWSARIKELMGDCEDKLADLKSKGEPKDAKDLEEQMVLANVCKDKLQASKPEISDGFAYGKELLENDAFDDGVKRNVKRDLDQLEGDFLSMGRASDEEVIRLQGRLKAMNAEMKIMEDWREKCNIVKSDMDAADAIVQEGKKAKSPDEIESCYTKLKDLTKDLGHTEPELNNTLDYGRKLSSNKDLSDDSRQVVSDDVVLLEEKWKALTKESQEEYARLGVELGASQEKQRNIAAWHERCDILHGWVNEKYVRLRSRPTSPESSFGGIKRQQSVIEDLIKELVTKQGEVNETIDEGNHIIDDDSMPEKDRKQVHEKMIALHDDWNKLANLTSGKQQSVQVLLLEKEQQHLDKTQNWRRKIDPLTMWISSAENRMNTQFEIAPDLDTVKKQKNDLEDFNNEMLSHQREVSDALETGDKLLKDSELPEDDRTAIQKEVLDLGHRWENLEELVSWKTERIDDTIQKLKMQQEDKLQKWHEGVDEVNVWVTKTRVKVESPIRLATDVDSALEQIDDFQNVIKDAPLYQEKVTYLNEFSSNLVSDPCLGEEERRNVREETAICNENWNDLVNLANAGQARLDENLDKLERQQQDTLERWRIRSERSGLVLDKLEGQISVIDDPIGNNLETVRRQEDAFEIFANEVDLNTPQMIDTISLGEKVRKDPKLTKKSKDEVDEHLDSLTARWDRVKDFMALRKERLGEAFKRLQRERREKLHEWEERLSSFDSFLRKAERETERLEPIGDDLETVKRQNEDFEQSAGLHIGQQKKVYDFENCADDLATDPVIDQRSKESIENDKNNRLERWARVVDKINNHQAKLEEELLNLEKTEGEFTRWNDQLVTIQEEVSKVESICEQEVAHDLERLEQQRKEAKKLKENVALLDPQIDEFLKSSDSLLDDSDLPDEDHQIVERESKLLENRWDRVKNDANSREPRIEEAYESLQKSQRALLDEWKNSCNSTLKWIADSSARVQAQDKTAPDLDHARAQRQEIEDVMKEIKQYDKQMDRLDQLGGKIVHDPNMRDLEKTLVTNEKASVIVRWQGLLSNTEAARNRLDKQIEQLEKEQREKMKMWSKKTEPLETWLVKEETVVESYEPIGYDISFVKGQSEDAQAMITDLLHEQPKFAEMTDFGNQLTTEPCVGLEERVRLQKEMQSLHERWDGLYGSATSRHDRIQERLRILEDEQRKLVEERQKLEEEEMLRRAEEEKRRQEEIERRRKEDEERRKREEEARRRREEEERKRREEEERLRREEEEERRRKIEEETKRREEEARKRKEEEERARKEEEERRKREEEERKRKEEEERKRREEERKKREEEERKKREEEDRKRKEEQERRKREQEERRKREEEERKKKEEEKRKQREEEERKRKERERKRKEEEEKKRQDEEERKRKEAEEKRKKEEEKIKAFAYIAPQPRVQLVEQEPRLFSSPVDEVIVSIDDVVEAGTEPDGIVLEGRLQDWRSEAEKMKAWIKDQDDKLPEESDKDNIATLKEKEGQIANLERELPVYDKHYHDLDRDFEELMSDKNIQEDQREEIAEDMDSVRDLWRSLNKNKDTKKNRIQKLIWDEEQKKAGELAGCRVNLQAVKDWIELRDKELEAMDPIGSDLKTLVRQKEDMKQFSKRLNDYEPRFTEATDSAYKLCRDPAFSEEQNKVLRQDAEDCEARWDDVLEKVKDRMDDIVKKIPKLQKDQKELLEEWKDRSSRFDKSLKKTEEKLKEQVSIGREIGFEKRFSEIRSPELTKRQGENNNEWKPSVDESNASLRRIREKLQDIQREKKNRKWSIIEALKDVMHAITTRFRGESKSGVHLDKVVDLLEDHEDIMTDTSSKQKDADEVFALSEDALESGMLESDQANDVHDRMTDLNHRWNGLNIDVIERGKRLEQLAQDIESEYKRFDSWRDKCDNMNQWLTESEKLIKNEEKIGSDIEVLQEQIKDNQLFLNEVKEYEPKVNAMVQESQDLVDSSKLDKTDIDGVDKTKNALNSRWKAVNDHLKERQQKLDSALLDILKKDTEGRLGRWRQQSIALGLLIGEATRKVEQDVDETDYGDIQASAVQLQEVEQSLAEDLSRELVEVSDSGREIIEKEELQPDAGDEISETLDALNRQVTDLEKGTRDKKDKIKEVSLKYFGRSLADCEEAVERLGETSVNSFTDVGSDIGEVGQQLAELQEFESDLVIEEATFSDIKDQFEDCKGTEMLGEEDRARIQRRIDALDEKWAELNKNHNENHRKLTHAMIVHHEELMEEIYDWLSDAEKQANSIAVNEDDISSVMEEYGRHRELKDEISSFEPTFKKAIGISDRLLTERLVDPERAESYETEIDTLEKRWKNLQLKTMDNGAKLSGVLGRYITTRLDDAEVILTHAESRISRDDADYLDLEAAKKALDGFRAKKTEINDSQKKVDEILTESQAIVKEDFFKEHERDHFQGRIDMIYKRDKGLEEKADKEERRMLDTYILLLKQHLQKMTVWLKMAESRIKQEGEIGPGYDDVKKQLEDHQVFQEELRDHSMITMILGVDITEPDINDNTQQQIKSLSDRWSKVWNWSEQRKHQLLKVLSNWQRFRDEQLILLNWLSSKEKTLKDMGRTDLTDENEVKEHLEKLRIIEKELDEQGIRLQSLHKAGDDLLKNVDKGDPAAKEINTQLKDFDDCWNDIARQVINRIQQLESSQSKINEFHSEMDATNEWMDETEKLLKSFSVGMEPEEATKLQEKTEIKCEERSRYATKVDRINQLGKDLAGEIDQPSHDAIQEELQPFNARWSDVSSQLENFSDKGYPQPGNECCFLRIMRRKFGVFQ